MTDTSGDPGHTTPVETDEYAPVADPQLAVPMGMRIAAAWSWRLLVVLAAVAVLLWLVVQVRIIVIPIFVAILLTALLTPIITKLSKHGVPRWGGVIAALLALFVSVGLLVYLIVTQFRSGFGNLAGRAQSQLESLLGWLEGGPLHLSVDEIMTYVQSIFTSFEGNSSAIWSGALSVGSTVGQFGAGTLLTLFTLIFLLIDGKRIWYWFVGFMPKRARAAVDGAGRSGWVSVGQYVRVQILVAFVDAVGIGLGAAILQVPMAVPLAVLVFLGSFIPFLGAIVTGALASFVALAYNGPVNALIMLGVVILVNQIEGHVLQPLVMGNAVRVHPLGVVLAVSTGAFVAGIPGALFAVPLAASLNAIVNYLSEGRWRGKPDPVQAYLDHEKDETAERNRGVALARRAKRRGPLRTQPAAAGATGADSAAPPASPAPPTNAHPEARPAETKETDTE
ncbi:AI-2E family transporter [Leucobacter sp. M11]|uniref:AI-2E family transporter n=1 Tax=Leucobacter sp. M11 TaxID=2993565 RepID=UPI002D7FD851|nr:AI-2E family transporter [Leucobacter sp. M11]MEB4615716.1 AI-2E family transporter [Leucobacter sp. M11]